MSPQHPSRPTPYGLSVALHLALVTFSLLYQALFTPHQAHLYAQPQTTERERVAVLAFKDEASLEPFERALLADSVRGAALNTPFDVMTRENMTALLPPNVTLEDCVGECEVDVGRSIGAHYIITGHLGRLQSEGEGGELRLLLRLYHTRSGALRAQSEARAGRVGALQHKARRAATQLFAQLAPTQQVVGARTLLWVKVSPQEATLTLDGFPLDPQRARPAQGDSGGLVWPITAGEHTLKASAPGHLSERVRLKVREGEPSEALITLKRRAHAARCDRGTCMGDVWVYTQPPGARVWVNGERTSYITRPNSTNPRLGSVALRLPEGSHWVRATLNKRSAERLIRVKGNTHNMDMRERPLRLKRPRASLSLSTSPPGALVRLNGEVIGKTPLKRKRLSPGAYWLEVVAEGRKSREELLTLEEGQRWRARWSLTPNTASLEVKVSYEGKAVEGASVWLSGQRLGVTGSEGTLRVEALTIGEGALEVRHPLYLPAQESVSLKAGEVLSERVALRGAWAELSVSLSEAQREALSSLGERAPKRLEVLWNGELIGELPLKASRVRAGPGWLQVRPSSEETFEPHRERLSLKVGEKQALEVSLTPHKARLELQSSPPNAYVEVDGEQVGRTPYRARLIAGLHRVVLRAEGYPPFSLPLWLTKEGHKERVDFKARTFVEVSCDPGKGDVLLNGDVRGPSPQVIDLKPGSYQVGCQLFGAEVSAPVELTAGEQLSRELRLSSASIDFARWRARWTPRVGKGAAILGALSLVTALTLTLGPLKSAEEERDRLARRWLEADDPSELMGRYQAWAEAERNVQRYSSWAQLSAWGGLSVSLGGGALWWWSAQNN